MQAELARGAWEALNFRFAPLVVLWTALKLGLFTALVDREKEISEIASSTACSPRGVRMVLDCMAAMGLLEKKGETYGLNDLSQRHFLPSGEGYIGQLFINCEPLLKLWLTLPEAVRTGRPTLSFATEEEKTGLEINIADALFQVHRASAWRLAELFDGGSSPSGRGHQVKILDVGAGSAVWSIPFALKYEHAQVAAMDLPPVLEIARKYTRQFGVESRYSFVEGDIRESDLGTHEYDWVLLGHICHSLGARGTQKLIGKAFHALRDKGRLLIIDFVPDEERCRELLPLLLAVNALLGAPEGDTFTFSEYKRWLMKAGFSEAHRVQVGNHSPIIVGLKA